MTKYTNTREPGEFGDGVTVETDPISNERLLPCPFCGTVPTDISTNGYIFCSGCSANGPYTKGNARAAWNTRALSATRTAVKPLAWRGDAADGTRKFTTTKRVAEIWRDQGLNVTSLYASPPPKAGTITDEMRQAIRVLKLIADGYSAKGDGLGEFVQVENPDYRPDNGSDPYIVVDIATISSEAHNGREGE